MDFNFRKIEKTKLGIREAWYSGRDNIVVSKKRLVATASTASRLGLRNGDKVELQYDSTNRAIFVTRTSSNDGWAIHHRNPKKPDNGVVINSQGLVKSGAQAGIYSAVPNNPNIFVYSHNMDGVEVVK